jgi:hypothetical protein
MSDLDNFDDTTFSVENWAESQNKKTGKSKLDNNAEAIKAIQTALRLRAENKSTFSLRSLLLMLRKEYGVSYTTSEGLRYWLLSRMPEEYESANF